MANSDAAQPDAAAAADGQAAPDPYMRILLHGDTKAMEVCANDAHPKMAAI